MNEVAELIAALKRRLKAQGLTYRDVAQALRLSEASVKRLFASERLSVERLAQLSGLLGLSMAELLQEVALAAPRPRTLDPEQEALLVADAGLLLVAVCALNHWTIDEMVAAYRMTRAECLKRLLVLDRMGVIAVLPGDRIRLKVARDFDWLPGGPIERHFNAQGMPDFLSARFDRGGETLAFSHGMLTPAAQAELQMELRRLRGRLATLHQESAAAPLGQRRGIGVLLATREWEPEAFAARRRPGAPGAPGKSSAGRR